MVSNLVGFSEIVVAGGLIYGFFNPRFGYFSGISTRSIIFIVTLSFLFTTPDTWKIVDFLGCRLTSFFLVKDIYVLAIAIMVVEHNKKLLGCKS